MFSVFMDNDTEIEGFMFKGEQFRSTDNDLIEKVIASNIPPAKVLEAFVEFVFNVDLKGILNIYKRYNEWKNTGNSSHGTFEKIFFN